MKRFVKLSLVLGFLASPIPVFAGEIIAAEEIEHLLTPKRSLKGPKERTQAFSDEAYRSLNKGEDPATRGIKIVKTSEGQEATVAVDTSATVSFDNVRFKIDSTELADAVSAKQLEEIAKALSKFGARTFVLEGHTCDLGDEAHNQKLSENRALAVGRFLRSRGVSCVLVPFGYGERDPKNLNDSEASREQNRRVVISLKS